jgi:hypothetical protein
MSETAFSCLKPDFRLRPASLVPLRGHVRHPALQSPIPKALIRSAIAGWLDPARKEHVVLVAPILKPFTYFLEISDPRILRHAELSRRVSLVQPGGAREHRHRNQICELTQVLSGSCKVELVTGTTGPS